jgi:ribosomal protein L17
MGRRTDTRRKGQTSSYNRAMYRNLVTDLLGYEKIITTESKAKRIRSLLRR